MNMVFLSRRDIVLRSVRPEDRELFLKWHNDPMLREKIGGYFPFPDRMFTEICEGKVSDTPSDLWFSVCLNGEVIGVAGLHSVKYVQRNAEMAVMVGEERNRSRGYGREILEMLVSYAFDTVNLHRVYARVYQGNLASIRLFESCGFRKEGELVEASYWNGRYRNVLIYGKVNRGG